MDAIQTISNIWPVVTTVVGLIVWLVRLEGKVSQSEKQLDALQIKHESLDSKVVEQLADVRESLARIEGALGVTSQNNRS
jgi:hypothetical protein